MSFVSNKVIVFPELSYEVVGAAFNVSNELGWGFSEKQYQQALASELEKRGIAFRREVLIPFRYAAKPVSRFFADFIVEGKILLELKVVPRLGYVHARQVLSYLKGSGLKLGILIYFTKDGVKYRRVLNPEV